MLGFGFKAFYRLIVVFNIVVYNRNRAVVLNNFLVKIGNIKPFPLDFGGTAVEVSDGKIEPSFTKEIIASKKRALAGQTAPPQGLFLEKVLY